MTIILLSILVYLIIIGIFGLIMFFIIRAICRYQAKVNAEAFDYDYLARRTAEEICKRMLLIKKQEQTEDNEEEILELP